VALASLGADQIQTLGAETLEAVAVIPGPPWERILDLVKETGGDQTGTGAKQILSL
jgi:hypothetical protein